MSEVKINKQAQSITFVNNGIGYSQFGIAKEILDLVDNQQQEIERLNKELNDTKEMKTKYFNENRLYEKDNVRLNNIITELEKYLENYIELLNYQPDMIEENERETLKEALDKLKELKGSDKE